MPKSDSSKLKTQTGSDQQPQETAEKQQAANQEESDFIERLTALQQELCTAQERERRSLADYQNLLRRVEGERSQLIRFANQELIAQLLPIFDNLQTAASQIQDQGLKIVVEQFEQLLAKFGVEKIEALGKKFDLDTMEAVDRRGEGDWVVEVMQQGYKLKEKILTHAKVVLGDKKDVRQSE